MKTTSAIKGLVLLLIIVTGTISLCAAHPPAKESDTAKIAEPVSPGYEFTQFRNDDGSRTLSFKLSYVKKLVPNAIKWVDVRFLAGSDLSTELGVAKTDVRGIASFRIPAGTILPVNESGTFTLGARFEGNEQFESVEDQISMKDIGMKFIINSNDSTKIAKVKVADATGKFDKSLTDAAVVFYVERMFKPLQIGESTLDENGEASIEFPLTLPGDSLGYVNLIARIEEDGTYGTIQADTVIRWGVPTFHKVPASFRALWTKVAPTWMVITLLILLVGVWGHYAFAVYKLVRIKKSTQSKMD